MDSRFVIKNYRHGTAQEVEKKYTGQRVSDKDMSEEPSFDIPIFPSFFGRITLNGSIVCEILNYVKYSILEPGSFPGSKGVRCSFISVASSFR
ncbi:MAG: hypothetical protein QG610_2433 [Euryarchaeota archaeon]|nr:hypothetical protein [Euryarchaeota archaeon]